MCIDEPQMRPTGFPTSLDLDLYQVIIWLIMEEINQGILNALRSIWQKNVSSLLLYNKTTSY